MNTTTTKLVPCDRCGTELRAEYDDPGTQPIALWTWGAPHCDDADDCRATARLRAEQRVAR